MYNVSVNPIGYTYSGSADTYVCTCRYAQLRARLRDQCTLYICTSMYVYYIIFCFNMFCAILLVFVGQRTRGIAEYLPMWTLKRRTYLRMYICRPAPVCMYKCTCVYVRSAKRPRKGA